MKFSETDLSKTMVTDVRDRLYLKSPGWKIENLFFTRNFIIAKMYKFNNENLKTFFKIVMYSRNWKNLGYDENGEEKRAYNVRQVYELRLEGEETGVRDKNWNVRSLDYDNDLIIVALKGKRAESKKDTLLSVYQLSEVGVKIKRKYYLQEKKKEFRIDIASNGFKLVRQNVSIEEFLGETQIRKRIVVKFKFIRFIVFTGVVTFLVTLIALEDFKKKKRQVTQYMKEMMRIDKLLERKDFTAQRVPIPVSELNKTFGSRTDTSRFNSSMLDLSTDELEL